MKCEETEIKVESYTYERDLEKINLRKELMDIRDEILIGYNALESEYYKSSNRDKMTEITAKMEAHLIVSKFIREMLIKNV